MVGCLGWVVMARLDWKRDRRSVQLSTQSRWTKPWYINTRNYCWAAGNGMVSMYVPRNLLKRNSSTLEEEVSPEKYFSITKGCYSSVNSILQSMCDNLCSSVGWDISQLPLSWDICEASQLLHLKFNTISNKEKKKIRLKAVSEDLKNILRLEYLVDCSQTNNDSKRPEENHDLEVPQDCKKPKKRWKTPRNERANW